MHSAKPPECLSSVFPKCVLLLPVEDESIPTVALATVSVSSDSRTCVRTCGVPWVGLILRECGGVSEGQADGYRRSYSDNRTLSLLTLGGEISTARLASPESLDETGRGQETARSRARAVVSSGRTLARYMKTGGRLCLLGTRAREKAHGTRGTASSHIAMCREFRGHRGGRPRSCRCPTTSE